MNVLEKILEEIDDIYVDDIAGYGVECNLEEHTNLPCNNCYECIKDACKAIVCKHMNNGKDINVISNDGWIPVEEKLPKKNNKPIYDMQLVTLEDGEVCLGVYNQRENEWWTRKQEGEKWYTNKYNVLAWQPLPEPYCPEKGTEE